jgi:predicted GIY-YIG superfamily endonuclease
MTFYVYKISRVDGLSYIGITNNVDKRFKHHRKSNRFSIGILNEEIITETDDYSEAENLEEFYINLYDTWKNGLNYTKDGKGLNGRCEFNTVGKTHSEETKNKMRENHWSKTGKYSPVGKKLSEETKNKLTAKKIGKVSYTKITKIDVIKLLKLYFSKPEIENVGEIRKNGKPMTYMRAFSKKYHSDFGMSDVGVYKILNGEIGIWKPLLSEIEKDYKY